MSSSGSLMLSRVSRGYAVSSSSSAAAKALLAREVSFQGASNHGISRRSLLTRGLGCQGRGSKTGDILGSTSSSGNIQLGSRQGWLNPQVHRSNILGIYNYSTETTTSNSGKDSKSSDDASKTEEGSGGGTVSEGEKKLQADIDGLQERYDDLLDKYRRSLAESDNMRKRLTKQIDDAKLFGIQGFCKDLLEVADVLSRAVDSVPEAAVKEEVKAMFEGLKLTQGQLQHVFKRHGLEKEDPINQKFDPNKHEALFQVPAPPDKEANVVMDVQKVGYTLHGRTIRPALVGVSKK